MHTGIGVTSLVLQNTNATIEAVIEKNGKIEQQIHKIIKKENKTVIMITHDIGEACSLADRVVVLTDRPAKIKKIFNIEMKNKSTPINNRKCPEFSEYYNMIWKEIDINDK